MLGMTSLLQLSNVTRTFTLPSGERLDILRGVDLTVEPGEIVAIVGRSGSGKSTLLNQLGLLDLPTSGGVRCNGVETTTMRDSARSRLRGEFLGFIFQQFHLLDRRTALENVAEPLLCGSRADTRHRFARASALLGQVGLADRAGSMPHLLSGGEQQRVAIARALVRSPRVLLADEPTGSLDETTGERVLRLLIDLVAGQRTALIIVTHDPDIAARADRVLTLSGGILQAASESVAA
jgi:putative ABC transport system ATP-binding protein